MLFYASWHFLLIFKCVPNSHCTVFYQLTEQGSVDEGSKWSLASSLPHRRFNSLPHCHVASSQHQPEKGRWINGLNGTGHSLWNQSLAEQTLTCRNSGCCKAEQILRQLRYAPLGHCTQINAELIKMTMTFPGNALQCAHILHRQIKQDKAWTQYSLCKSVFSQIWFEDITWMLWER